jgi:parallel beta-helix repeat protein
MKRLLLSACNVGLGLSLLLLPVSRPARSVRQAGGGIFTVNTANDSNTRGDAELSLREAIRVANGTLTGPFSLQEQSQFEYCIFTVDGYIQNDCGGGNNTIQFAQSLLEVTINAQLPVLSRIGITINGQVTGGRVVVNSSVNDWALVIAADNTLLENITVINAAYPISQDPNVAIKGLKISNAYLGVIPGSTSCTRAPLVRRPLVGLSLSNGSGSAAAGDGTAYLTNSVVGCALYDGVAVKEVSFVHIGETADGSAAGNWIGVDPFGNPLANGTEGVLLCCSTLAKKNTVVHNMIAHNLDGIAVAINSSDTASGNTIRGNTIYNNQAFGIWVINSGLNTLADNLLHQNGSSGIRLWGESSINNVISGGAIYANHGPGIAEGGGANKNSWSNLSTYDNYGLGIDKGDNGQVDPPPLTIDSVSTSAGGVTTVSGTYTASIVSPTMHRVDLYRLARDPSGYGEGRTFVGSYTLSYVAPVDYTWHIIDSDGPGCYTAVVTDFQPAITWNRTSSEFSMNTSCPVYQVYLPVLEK